MKIEWASNFNDDGSRKKPAPSKMHGWLAKMRGTLLGDEKLRSRGMREMRDATVYKQRQKEKARKARGGRSVLGAFLAGKKAPTRPSQSRSQSHRSQALRRSSPPSRKPSSRPGPAPRRSSTRTHLTRSSTQQHQSRPTARRRNTTR